MQEAGNYRIITFYEFKKLGSAGYLKARRAALKELMLANSILGTIIVAAEGYNGTVCGTPEGITVFIDGIEKILETTLRFTESFHEERTFHKIKVKIKPEIVTLRKTVDIDRGRGTHVAPTAWNRIISQPGIVILDTRNDYEVEIGSFAGAIDPKAEKFSDLPKFVAENLDPLVHKKVAMFCTGGIRCEKFAPFLKEQGFEEVFQLEGGILKYLEETPHEDSLWRGECFVFDDRISVDHNLQQGKSDDLRPLTINPPTKK